MSVDDLTRNKFIKSVEEKIRTQDVQFSILKLIYLIDLGFNKGKTHNALFAFFDTYFPTILFESQNIDKLKKIMIETKGEYDFLIKKTSYSLDLGIKKKYYYNEISSLVLLMLENKKNKKILAEINTMEKELLHIIAPNLNILLPNEVLIKLLIHTTGLKRLSQLTGSKIQVLGAEKALHKHKKGKSTSPKYGYIYEVNFIKKTKSGKLARYFANKLSIAAKIDYFYKNINKDFIDTIYSSPMMSDSTSPEGNLY
ncbi:MAG: hypothetical protein ACMXYF_05625 [Candidatus Woesearchaeota archaeon]